MTAHNPYSHGGYEQYNAHWKDIQSAQNVSNRVIFTRGHPLLVKQLYQRAYFQDICSLMGERRSSAQFLEFGSGRGTTSMYLASEGYDVSLVDRSLEAFRLARINFDNEEIDCPEMILTDVERSGIKSESYDCVFSIGLLEHFEDPRSTLRESYRLLKPGGLIFHVIVPAFPLSKMWFHNVLFALLLFAPGNFVFLMRRLSSRRVARKEATEKSGKNLLRTNHKRDQYLEWLQELGAAEVRCIPYNPYYVPNNPYYVPTARSRIAYKAILFLYAWHLELRKRMKGKRTLLLETMPMLETCYLLAGVKP